MLVVVLGTQALEDLVSRNIMESRVPCILTMFDHDQDWHQSLLLL